MTIGKDIRSFIDRFSDQPALLDRMVVTAFVHNNDLKRYSAFIASFIDEEEHALQPLGSLQTLEDLINVFEVAIPKNDRVTNGAIYTPAYIREFIIDESSERCDKSLETCRCADIACGCGAFLMTLAELIKRLQSGLSYQEIYSRLWGVDICAESVRRTKIVLSLQAALHGEVIDEESLHLIVGITLSHEINDKLGLFDLIVGNPPYVRAKHIDEKCKQFLRDWDVSRCGNADLYIPFFEIALKHLNDRGVVGLITPNSYFKSVNARSLRKYLANHSLAPIIWNFGEEKVFKKKMVYTCITVIGKRPSGIIHYVRVSTAGVLHRRIPQFSQINMETLDHHKGWSLSTREVMANIARIESVGRPLGELFPIKNGIATLANGVFIFRPNGESGEYYLHKGMKIEKDICRDIVKPNIVKSEEELETKREKIIFPYDHSLALFEETFLKENYPFAYAYLLKNKSLLLLRDKGEGDYPWYAFGRSQAIADYGKKLLFPYMTDTPHFVYTSNEGMLIYCGYAIYNESEEELQVLKRILESPIFAYYIRHTSKPYSTGYYSYAKNYVKGFGVPPLDEDEKRYLLGLSDQCEIGRFLNEKYGIKL